MGDVNLTPVKVTCDLTPLVQSIPNGVSKIFDLVFGKMVAKREAAEKLLNAQTERQSRLIIDGKASLDNNGTFINFEQVQSDNIQQCLEYAVNEALHKEDNPPEKDISRTFFNKWRDYAQHIDEDSLKEFWGRILVEEIYNPSTIDLRVLNTLSMLSQKEAKIFNEAIKYIIFNEYLAIDFIPSESKHRIIETLYSIGAISSIPKPGLRLGTRIWRFKNDFHNYHCFYHQKNNFCITFNVEDSIDDDGEGISLELLELTVIGKTLYNLAISIDEQLSINLAKTITKDMLNQIDRDKALRIVSINVYRLKNQTVTDNLFSKTFK
ncbi:Protein of uncharacterised function (DUF2806) [Actinobacillus lignieresii]|uniref:DUF2806 domain-containing protein n=1 Tax=Actinobacillus lignieresii TaxID=720 RepID=UPI000E1591D7|nr:DUF2806 domain-containing protein [Actinobacillus lignieresii]SUT97163.1 Protein of uncharacterised function (DUF2806) [Actinobacillus lignieresii]VEB26138.1 Protein of uncharacterised function (DUF2806) [Actinobacillus lignieresii]